MTAIAQQAPVTNSDSGADVAAPTEAGEQPRPGVSSGMAPPTPEDSAAVCDAEAASFAVGRRPTQRLSDLIRRKTRAGSVRVIPEGGGATRDFQPDRINIQLNKAGRIAAIVCG